MIIIPEIETVVLQPPRTGSSTVKDEILERYPKAFALYRHMEYAGLPMGYGLWRVVCQVREPCARMESLFKYMRAPELRGDTDPMWLAEVKKATSRGFKHWLLEDGYVFANPTPSAGKAYRPRYQVAFPWREQVKSQGLWAAQATHLLHYESLGESAADLLGIQIKVRRGATSPETFIWDNEMGTHMRRWHSWDLALYDPTALYP